MLFVGISFGLVLGLLIAQISVDYFCKKWAAICDKKEETINLLMKEIKEIKKLL